MSDKSEAFHQKVLGSKPTEKNESKLIKKIEKIKILGKNVDHINLPNIKSEGNQINDARIHRVNSRLAKRVSDEKEVVQNAKKNFNLNNQIESVFLVGFI